MTFLVGIVFGLCIIQIHATLYWDGIWCTETSWPPYNKKFESKLLSGLGWIRSAAWWEVTSSCYHHHSSQVRPW